MSNAVGKRSLPAPSQQASSVWAMSCSLTPQEFQLLAPAIQSSAQKVLKRGADGGTDSPLQHVGFFFENRPRETAGPLRIDTSGVDQVPGAGASSTSNIVASTTSAASTRLLRIVLIFGADGRVKSSVTRSLSSIFTHAPEPYASALKGSLHAESLLWVLAILTQSTAHIETGAGEMQLSDFESYLTRRAMREGWAKPEALVSLGLDLLGPTRPKPERPRPDAAENPMKLLKGDSVRPPVPPPVPPRVPEASRAAVDLAGLLGWSDELTADVAAERAAQLLQVLHATVEENAVLKLQLQFYEERDKLESQVCSFPLPTSIPPSHPIRITLAVHVHREFRGPTSPITCATTRRLGTSSSRSSR